MSKLIPLEDDLFPPFEGFPKECLDFLKKLKRNNNRQWFQQRKQDYLDYVKFPMQCLIASLSQRMIDDAPEIVFDPKRSIFRIYRDVRFSKNKAPYKTSVAAVFELRGKKSPAETPGLYLHIEPGDVFIGGGIYMPTGEQLKAIRKAIVDRPKEYLAIVSNKKFKKEFGGIQGEKLQKAPLGFPKDHPMIDHLRHKQFYVGKEYAETVCLRARFLETTASNFVDTMPLVRWLVKATA